MAIKLAVRARNSASRRAGRTAVLRTRIIEDCKLERHVAKSVSFKDACHSERSGVSAANGTQSRNLASYARGCLRDSSTPLRPALCNKVLGFAPLGMTRAFFPGVLPEKCMTGSSHTLLA